MLDYSFNLQHLSTVSSLNSAAKLKPLPQKDFLTLKNLISDLIVTRCYLSANTFLTTSSCSDFNSFPSNSRPTVGHRDTPVKVHQALLGWRPLE